MDDRSVTCDECTSSATVKGKCRSHYVKAWKHANIDRTRASSRKSAKKRREAGKVAPVPLEYQREYTLEYRRSPKGRYITAKAQAKRRGWVFEIPLTQFTELVSLPCHYCHGPLNPTSTGLDRVDNSVGYIPSNVVPCCRACNCIKGKYLTYNEAVVALKAVHEYRSKKTAA